jgi:hypothetical protein
MHKAEPYATDCPSFARMHKAEPYATAQGGALCHGMHKAEPYATGQN